MKRKNRWKAITLCLSFLLAIGMLPGIAGHASAAPDAGDGSAGNPYIIDEPSDLVWMGSNFATVKSKSFRQVGDIDMSGVSFTPIGDGTSGSTGSAFNGTYDGQRYAIKNLTINANLYSVALFQYLDFNAVVKDVHLQNVNITSTGTASYAECAGIAGHIGSQVTVSGCSVSGAITCAGASFSSYAAGIAGVNYSDILDCSSTASISNATANGYCGGIAGYQCYSAAETRRCYFAGTLGGAAATKGGIVGNNWEGTYSNNVFLSSSAFWAIGSDASNSGATAASSAQMKQAATYSGWNFTTVWKISEGADYPRHITAPGTPANVAVSGSDGQLTVSWDAAARASGYRLYIGTSAGSYGAPIAVSGTNKTVTGLANGTTYYIAVKALHSEEEGAPSDEASGTPYKTITDLAATADSNRVDLTFTPPEGASLVELQESTGGAYSAVAGVSLTNASTGAQVTGLVNSTQYSFRLRFTYDATEYFSNVVTVKAGNTVNKLSALSASGCTINEPFSSTTTAYTASVSSGVTEVSVTATLQSGLSTLAINGSAQASGAAKTVALEYGGNAVNIVVTAENGDTRTYSLTVTRALPAGAVTHIADQHWGDWAGNELYAGCYEGSVENAALKFDLSEYTGELTSATLMIYVNRTDSSGVNGTFSLYGSDDDSWTTDTPSDWDEDPILPHATAMPDGWYSIDVSDYVSHHLQMIDSVVTFYFAGEFVGDGTQDIAFYSPANATNKPYLALTYQSNDNTLASISIGGVPLAGYSPLTTDYTYSAPHGSDLSALVFASVVNDSNATQSAWTYNASQNKWSVTVTAETGDTRTYNVTVSVAKSADATLKAIKVGGMDLSGFVPGTLNYTYNVVHGTNIAALVFTSEVNDHMATQGSWSYDAAHKKWSVTVTAEDGVSERIYTVTVNELPSADATLKSIQVGGVDLLGFAPDTLNYTYNVPHGTNIAALVFSSEVSDHMATQDAWSYDAAHMKWGVTVTAEDGATSKTYTVTVNELPSTDTTLKGIKVGGVDLAGFAPGTLNYTFEVPHGTDNSSLVFTSEVNDHMATQSAWSYDAAQKKWSVTVTAEDGTTQKTYTVTITQPANTDATLSGIKVGGTALPSFSPATRAYSVNVPHGTNIAGLTLSATATDPAAHVGAWSYDAAQKKWSVTVMAEDGVTALTYAVTFVELPSTDATLSVIRINGAAISGFSPSKLSYTVNVVHGTNPASLTLTSLTTDPEAVQGAWAYDAALAKWSITVTAEDGTTKKTYAVFINVLPSSNATLSFIRLDGDDLEGFSPLVLNYTITLPYDTDIASLYFYAEPSDDMASAGDWQYDGENQKWSVTVTAENGVSTRTYTIKVLLAPTPSPTATDEPTPQPTLSPAPEDTATATASAEPSESATATPGPTQTPEPTPAPTLAPDNAMKVTFLVTDGTNPIAGAALTLEGVRYEASAAGIVNVSLSAGSYAYTAEMEGYESASGTVTVSRDGDAYCILLVKKGTVVLRSGDENGSQGGNPQQGGAVLIAGEGALPQGGGVVKLIVKEVPSEQEDTDSVKQEVGDEYQIVGLFDIYLLLDTTAVQPDKPVRVGVPIPENLIGKSLQIVRINDDGTVTTFDTMQAGGMLFFTADHFSRYAIIAVEPPMLPLWLIIALAALLLALAVLILCLLILRKKKSS